MPLLGKDKVVNKDNVRNNFILLEQAHLKLRKKVSIFSLQEAKKTESLQPFKTHGSITLPEPGVFLNREDPSFLLEEDFEKDIVGELFDKYRFFYRHFKKDLKYTLFKPIYKNSNQVHTKVSEDNLFFDLLSDFNSSLQRCIHSIKHANIQPKLMSEGSSGTYIIFGSELEQHQLIKPMFIFKPMNEEPYSRKFQPKWLKYLQYKLLPFTFGRSCLLEEGNYGYITDLLVSRLDYLLFKEDSIVPWCDVCVLESGSFFNNIKTTEQGLNKNQTQIQAYRNNAGMNISQSRHGGLIFLCFLWIRDLCYKLFSVFRFYATGGYKAITVQRKLGSVQKFESGFKTASEFFAENPLPESYLSHEETFGIWSKTLLDSLHMQLQKLYILDFITRNTDRNLDNWMLRINDFSSVEIKAIDNSLAFPYKHPSSLRTYPFEWLTQLPRYFLERPMDINIIKNTMEKLSDDNWWNDWRVIFWECHSRSGKVSVQNRIDGSQSIFANSHLKSDEAPYFELAIDYKVNLQWSLFKGQAFLLYKLFKGGLSGIEVNVLDLVQMERCYVYEDPCFYYHPANSPDDNCSLEDDINSEQLNKEIWEGLGLDVNIMLNKKTNSQSSLNDNLSDEKLSLEAHWKLYLNGEITDQDWLEHLRHFKNFDNGISKPVQKSHQNYNPFLENSFLENEPNETENLLPSKVVSETAANDVAFTSPSKYTIASLITKDTSVISEYFYDANSTVDHTIIQNESDCFGNYESLPMDILPYKNELPCNISRNSRSMLPIDTSSSIFPYANSSLFAYNVSDTEDSNASSLPLFDASSQKTSDKFKVEVAYIDRLEICKEKKPWFSNW